MIDFVTDWSEKTELAPARFAAWLGIQRSQLTRWRERYGKVNEHNGKIPRDHWLLDSERQAILDFFDKNPLEGYRRLTYMMLDQGVVAVSPATVYRVLSAAGRLDRWHRGPSKKGTGFKQPDSPHRHWHVDIAYINLAGTFYYLCSVLDGYSRYIVHWDLRESMTERDVECILQRARELFPEARPRIVTDNGPQFIARDFKEFIRVAGMTHVRISPGYPQSNGKLERWHKTFKSTALRPAAPSTIDQARRVTADFVEHYNARRLHSAIGYIAPSDKLAGREAVIFAERDRKLEAARELRRQRRELARQHQTHHHPSETCPPASP